MRIIDKSILEINAAALELFFMSHFSMDFQFTMIQNTKHKFDHDRMVSKLVPTMMSESN